MVKAGCIKPKNKLEKGFKMNLLKKKEESDDDDDYWFFFIASIFNS